MSDAVRAVILGIIEGLTEFLPVSSTGHLVLAMPLLGIDGREDPWPAFLYFIQIGAILAVVLYFFHGLWRQMFRPSAPGWRNHVAIKITVGVIPGAIVGLTLNEFMEAHLEKPIPVAVALIVGALALVLIERRYRKTEGPTIDQVTLRQSFFVGLAQCVAIIPGTSRSMATIAGGLMAGLPAATAAEFSFYLAIPTLCGAGILRVIKHWDALGGENATIMWIGFAVSFAVAWLAISGFMRYIQTRSLSPFAIYRIVLGLAVLGFWWAS